MPGPQAHGLVTPAASRASHTRSRVSGSSVKRSLVASHGASAKAGATGFNGLSLIDLAPRGPMASAVSEAHGLRTRPQQARGLADAVRRHTGTLTVPP